MINWKTKRLKEGKPSTKPVYPCNLKI